jgi:hypothetical protein
MEMTIDPSNEMNDITTIYLNDKAIGKLDPQKGFVDMSGKPASAEMLSYFDALGDVMDALPMGLSVAVMFMLLPFSLLYGY